MPRRPWVQVILISLVIIVIMGLSLVQLLDARNPTLPSPARLMVQQTSISTPIETSSPATHPVQQTPPSTPTATPSVQQTSTPTRTSSLATSAVQQTSTPPTSTEVPSPAYVIQTPISTPAGVPSPTSVVPTVTPTAITFPPSEPITIPDPLLSNADNRWDVGSDVGSTNLDPNPGSCQFIGQGYQIAATYYYHQCDDKIDTFANGTLQVHMQVSSGSSGGFVFRTNTSTHSGYLFEVDSLGNYEVLRADPGSSHTIKQATSKNGSLQNLSIGVLAEGSSIHVYINDTEVYQFPDSTYAYGGIALIVDGSYPLHVPNTQVVFTDLKIWNF